MCFSLIFGLVKTFFSFGYNGMIKRNKGAGHVKLLMLLGHKHAYNCYGFLDLCKNHKREEDASIKGYFRQQENTSYGFRAELLVVSIHVQQLESIR